MTADTSVRCALGVTSRTLSDFRSDGLSAPEMERLRAHVEQCSACQARLDEFAAVARTLRRHPDTSGHAELWRDVCTSIAAMSEPSVAREHRSASRPGRPHSTRLWTAFGSLAAVVALSVGFVALFFSRGGWPPASRVVTPITIHSGKLTWRQVIVPKGFPDIAEVSMADTYSALVVAQSDGATAYACQANRRYVSSPRVWATHDAGAHWSVITPANLPANTGGCRITLDANDANTLAISFFSMLSPQQAAPPTQWVTYATSDGGSSWSTPAGLQGGVVMYSSASAHGRIYALRAGASPSGQMSTGLYVSDDQMWSWKRIDASLPDTQPNPPQIHDTGKVFKMWVNPASGEVLMQTYAGSLWSTMNDGARWAKLTYPRGVSTADPWAPMLAVGGPTTSGYLMICGVFAPLQSPETHQLFECTANDGLTWSTRPASVAASAYPAELVAVGADGSLYALVTTPSAPGKNNAGSTFYRLPPGATTPDAWLPLGAIPGSQYGSGGYQSAPSANGTLFWDFPGITTETSGSYTKTYAQPNLYVATYP